MTKSLALAFTIFAAALCLAVQPAHAQKVSGPPPPSETGAGMGQGQSTATSLYSAREINNTSSDPQMPPDIVLQKNPKLNSRLQPLLPVGITPKEAAEGYQKTGDFLTAVHAAHDLGIPFLQLRCAELGGKYCPPETHAKSTKIENAILATKPDAGKDGAKQAVKAAKQEGKVDLQSVNVQ